MTSPTQHSETDAAPLPTDRAIIECIAVHLMGWHKIPPCTLWLMRDFWRKAAEESWNPLEDDVAGMTVLDRLAELYGEYDLSVGQAGTICRVYIANAQPCMMGRAQSKTPESRRRAIVLCAHAVAVQIALASAVEGGKGKETE